MSQPSPGTPDRQGPQHPDDAAELRERADGAHEEQISDETTLRADDTPPGTEPDDA